MINYIYIYQIYHKHLLFVCLEDSWHFILMPTNDLLRLKLYIIIIISSKFIEKAEKKFTNPESHNSHAN